MCFFWWIERTYGWGCDICLIQFAVLFNLSTFGTLILFVPCDGCQTKMIALMRFEVEESNGYGSKNCFLIVFLFFFAGWDLNLITVIKSFVHSQETWDIWSQELFHLTFTFIAMILLMIPWKCSSRNPSVSVTLWSRNRDPSASMAETPRLPSSRLLAPETCWSKDLWALMADLWRRKPR